MSERIFNVSRSTKTGKTVNVGDFPTVEQAQAGERPDAQQAGELVLQAVCLDVKAGLFFHINTIDHG